MWANRPRLVHTSPHALPPAGCEDYRPPEDAASWQPPGRFLTADFAISQGFGYHLARMPFEIVLSSEAVSDLRRLSAFERAKVREAIEVHLRHEPTKISKSRIKRLRELAHPQYRLRVDDFRVFYDVKGEEVQVLAIVAKTDADEWLKQVGQSDEDGSALGSEG
jgi:mRNA interferase RelE/StbE